MFVFFIFLLLYYTFKSLGKNAVVRISQMRIRRLRGRSFLQKHTSCKFVYLRKKKKIERKTTLIIYTYNEICLSASFFFFWKKYYVVRIYTTSQVHIIRYDFFSFMTDFFFLAKFSVSCKCIRTGMD